MSGLIFYGSALIGQRCGVSVDSNTSDHSPPLSAFFSVLSPSIITNVCVRDGGEKHVLWRPFSPCLRMSPGSFIGSIPLSIHCVIYHSIMLCTTFSLYLKSLLSALMALSLCCLRFQFAIRVWFNAKCLLTNTGFINQMLIGLALGHNLVPICII